MTRHDSAMQAVTAKADKLIEGWSDDALGFLKLYLKWVPGQFIAEDFAQFAFAHGLEESHDGRSMGSVMKQAAKSGLIRRVGYKADRWGSPKSLWVAK